MGVKRVPAGQKIPDIFNVIIEIPAHSGPVKYEVNKETGALHVDRFMSTAMFYPCNYGYIPQTLAEDGDPVDVLVITPVPLISGSVVAARAIGVLEMTDESGEDHKILAVPTEKLLPMYANIQASADVSPHLLASISHFFEHYKDLEEGKWVKVNGWETAERAKKIIEDAVAQYQ